MPAQAFPNPLVQHQGGLWTLPEFVDVVNDLLPTYLPKEAAGRAADEVNARLVRYYTTQGLLPEARREGREARYIYEHLVAALLVRKLLAEGFSSNAIRQVMEGRDTPQLQSLLDGGLRIQLVPDEAAPDPDGRAAFLAQVRQRARLDGGHPQTTPHAQPFQATPGTPAAPSAVAPVNGIFHETSWTRIDLFDGLELLVRDDFQLPTNRLGDEQLTQLLKVVLLQLEQKRKAKP
jgi:DNA-binding transcriptional MerR regulator